MDGTSNQRPSSRLIYHSPINLVGAIGFEPTTPTMSRWCSNQLSYAPDDSGPQRIPKAPLAVQGGSYSFHFTSANTGSKMATAGVASPLPTIEK